MLEWTVNSPWAWPCASNTILSHAGSDEVLALCQEKGKGDELCVRRRARATTAVRLVCEHSNISSLCPNLGLLPDAVIDAVALLFGGFFSTLGRHAFSSDRCDCGEQVDLATLVPDA
jgi:hypothetical protein